MGTHSCNSMQAQMPLCGKLCSFPTSDTPCVAGLFTDLLRRVLPLLSDPAPHICQHLLQLLLAAAKERVCLQDLLRCGVVPALLGIYKGQDLSLAEKASEVRLFASLLRKGVCPGLQ